MAKLLLGALGLSTLIAAVALACGGSGAATPTGGLRQACYGNGTCNAGLSCFSGVCVEYGDGGSSSGSGSSGSGSGAGSSSSGSSGGSGSSSGSGSGSGSGGSDGGVADADAAPDAAPCTPWPDGGIAYACLISFQQIQAPGEICVRHGGGGYVGEPAPAACTACQEDYNCACFIGISNECDAGLCGCRLGGSSALAGCTDTMGQVMLACQY